MISIEILVDGCIGLFDLGVGGRLEVEVQVLGEVPAQREVAVPEELLVEGQRQLLSAEVFEVALLQFEIGTRDLRVETDALRQIIQSERLGEVEPL